LPTSFIEVLRGQQCHPLTYTVWTNYELSAIV
jgi:hypothetical protein